RYTVVPYGIVPVPESEIRPFDVQSPLAEFEVLFVGRLEKRKGVGVLFKAIPQVLADVPNVRFRIVGADNSAFDGFQRRTGLTYRDYFARHYARYTSRVIFEGEVSDTRLQQLYQQCDLFVLPSLYESFGLVYLEAMNYAKPVIGCWTGGVPEVIEQGVSGALVAPGSDKALAAMIVELLQSPCKLHDYGMAGRHQVLEKFSYLQMARRFAEVYRRVIRRAADSPETLSLR
ncbi:MAG: glycosyltransferase family 4 protein, partial [Anaerolineae bacterium]|nr:glycosyltransferase family 4 protein [Anaerolineae bacterium]